MTKNEFKQRCDEFYKQYQATKHNPSRARNLGPLLTRPISKAIRQVEEVECRSGCSHCCYLRVVAFGFEIIAIYNHIKSNLNDGELLELQNDIEEKCKFIKSLSIEKHFKTNIQCPLLKNNKCSVYKVRPISCAGYHSLSEKSCIDSYNNPNIVGMDLGGVPKVPEVLDEQSIQNTVVLNVLQHTNETVEQYELISALREIFNNPGIIEDWQLNNSEFKETKGVDLIENHE